VFNVTPTQVRSSGLTSTVTFSTTQTLTNPAACGGLFYAVTPAHQSQSALAVLLAAYFAGRNISIYVLGGGCDPTSGGIIVTDVMTSP
jgi:hypothetical protein